MADQRDPAEILIPACEEVRVFINTGGDLAFLSTDLAGRADESLVVIPRAMVPKMIKRIRELMREPYGSIDE